jgi:hypothetical protein
MCPTAYMLETNKIPDTPKNAAVMIVIATPPMGRTATTGPSQLAGMASFVWLAARLMLAPWHDAEYPIVTLNRQSSEQKSLERYAPLSTA